jgi:hypothetical protein
VYVCMRACMYLFLVLIEMFHYQVVVEA